MNRNLVLAAVVTGILCGVWAGVAPLVNLSIWAGFAGTTAYFASGKSGAKGLFLTIATTFVGVGTALGMIAGSDLIGPPFGTADADRAHGRCAVAGLRAGNLRRLLLHLRHRG